MRTIVLNGDYSYLNTITWRRALALLMKGKAETLKYSDKVIRCVDGSYIKLPLVLRLIKVIRLIYKNRVPYSKKNVMFRDNHSCAYCGSNKNLTIDHVIPLSKGGKTTFDNCVTACFKCNNKKNDRTPSEVNMFLQKRPYTPTISEFFRLKMKLMGIDTFLKEIGVY